MIDNGDAKGRAASDPSTGIECLSIETASCNPFLVPSLSIGSKIPVWFFLLIILMIYFDFNLFVVEVLMIFQLFDAI